MMTTYDRLMREARVTRHRETTYDHRDPHVLIAQLTAEVEALRARVKELEGMADLKGFPYVYQYTPETCPGRPCSDGCDHRGVKGYDQR